MHKEQRAHMWHGGHVGGQVAWKAQRGQRGQRDQNEQSGEVRAGEVRAGEVGLLHVGPPSPPRGQAQVADRAAGVGPGRVAEEWVACDDCAKWRRAARPLALALALALPLALART